MDKQLSLLRKKALRIPDIALLIWTIFGISRHQPHKSSSRMCVDNQFSNWNAVHCIHLPFTILVCFVDRDGDEAKGYASVDQFSSSSQEHYRY